MRLLPLIVLLLAVAAPPAGAARQPQVLVPDPGVVGFSGGLALHSFGRETEYAAFRAAAWYARGSWKGGLMLDWGPLFERSASGWERASAAQGSLGLSWRIPGWSLGFYGSGHALAAAFESGASSPNRWSPGLSVGLESAFQTGLLPTTFRLGYVRLFGDRTPNRHGFALTADLPFWAF